LRCSAATTLRRAARTRDVRARPAFRAAPNHSKRRDGDVLVCDPPCLRSHGLGCSRDHRSSLRRLQRAVWHGPRMRSHPIRSHPRGDGSPCTAHPNTGPPLQVSGARSCRPLHAGQTRCCSVCGDRSELCPRAGRRFVALHPAGSAAAEVPEDCREQLSAGIARPRGDGIDWCRSSRRLVCPRRAVTSRARLHLEVVGLYFALRALRAIDTGVRATSATASRSARPSAAFARPVADILRNLCPGSTQQEESAAPPSPRAVLHAPSTFGTPAPRTAAGNCPQTISTARARCPGRWTSTISAAFPAPSGSAGAPQAVRTAQRVIGSCLDAARPRSRPCIPRRSPRRGAGV
jgi:hypothetical protein